MGKRRDEPDEPTLELPSFFRRRKRRTDDAATAPASEAPADDPTLAAEPQPEPQPAPEPEPESAPEPAPEPEPEPESESTAEPEPQHPPTVAEPAPTVSATGADDAEDTSVLEPAPSPAEPQRPGPVEAPAEVASEAAPAAGGRRAARSRRSRAPRRSRAARSSPALSAGAASLVAGALVGLVGTGLTWAALQGCEALRGTDSCGGPGLLVLVAILALMVVGGALVLKALKVAEPNATSFLGVGLMTVIVLVTLMESLFSAWMFLAVPVLTALSYLAAQWVSTRFVDTEEASPGVDVR